MSTVISDNGPRAHRVRPAAKAGIDIKLDQHWTSKAYTSGSKVTGNVIVNTQRDVAFDTFEIFFTGTAYTRIDFVSQYSSANYAARPFMKLRMPLNPSDFPSTGVFEAGRTYTIPFHFVVPHQLTLSACNHTVEHEGIRDHHLQLPPTMGFWERNDQSPDTAHIEYGVRAVATHNAPVEGRTTPLDGFHMIKVLPAVPEDAPLEICAKDERYCLSKTKPIRKNLFSAKQGELTTMASQPSAIMLSGNFLNASGTNLRVNLEFKSTSKDVTPPKINSVSAKLQSTTFFSSAPMTQLPNLGSRIKHQSTPSLTYSTTTPVPMRPDTKLFWEDEAPSSRRDSGYDSAFWNEGESSESEEAQRTKKASKFNVRRYATLDIPFNLPTSASKLFLPTFYSCISARAYIVHLTLSVGSMNTSINLDVPVQIAVENTYDQIDDDELPSFDAAIAEAEQGDVDVHMAPLLMREAPSARFQNHNILPSYEDMRMRHPVAAA
ncbi:Ff.00g027340.m01.CDS01 [Fusarium sp. VM40]|nr:Ff.00g027340.m01.CDS01 [Fusarium sp. VM40]